MTNRELVAQAVHRFLEPSLLKYLRQHFESKYGDDWASHMLETVNEVRWKGTSEKEDLGDVDFLDLVNVLLYGRRRGNEAAVPDVNDLSCEERCYLHELKPFRHADAHFSVTGMADDRAWRLLDTASRALKVLDAEKNAEEIERLRDSVALDKHTDSDLNALRKTAALCQPPLASGDLQEKMERLDERLSSCLSQIFAEKRSFAQFLCRFQFVRDQWPGKAEDLLCTLDSPAIESDDIEPEYFSPRLPEMPVAKIALAMDVSRFLEKPALGILSMELMAHFEEAAAPALIHLHKLITHSPPDFVAVADPDYVIETIAQATVSVGPDAVPFLIDLLQNKYWLDVAAAARAIGDLNPPSAAAPALPALLGLFSQGHYLSWPVEEATESLWGVYRPVLMTLRKQVKEDAESVQNLADEIFLSAKETCRVINSVLSGEESSDTISEEEPDPDVLESALKVSGHILDAAVELQDECKPAPAAGE